MNLVDKTTQVSSAPPLQRREALDNSLDNQKITQIWIGESGTQANNKGFSGCVKVRKLSVIFSASV